jgi:hypothetical protein
VLIGLTVMVSGVVLALGARSDREDSEAAVAQQQGAVALAGQELTAAESDLEAAREDGAVAAAELSDSEAQRADTKATLEVARMEIPAFVAAVDAASASAAEVRSAIGELPAQGRTQVEALIALDYVAFNALRAQYAELTTSVAGQLDGYSSQMESLPHVSISNPYQYDGPTEEARVPTEPVALDPPTGAAVIAVELPDQLACDAWGNAGCHYQWTARFVESNWLDVTITRIGVRYRGGGGYCTGVGSEWVDVTLNVDANGDAGWSDQLHVDRDSECRPVIGGDLLVRWEGTDAEGNDLSGRITADLERPQ